MGINIVVFTPVGLVVSADYQSEIRNKDDGFFLGSVERNFILFDKYIISFVGDGFIEGLPYGFYVNDFLTKNQKYKGTVKDLAILFSDFIKSDRNRNFYIAGYDCNDDVSSPKVYIIDANGIHPVNENNEGQSVYNYHVSGDSMWINKMLLGTHFEDKEHHEKIDFEPLKIDFSKYSLVDGVNFAQSLIAIDQTMDMLEQRKPVLNRNINIAVIDPIKGAYFFK